MIKVGQKAPEFKLKDQSQNEVSLSDYAGNWVVLFFYPKDLTPGCTIEACEFRDSLDKIKEVGAIVLGIGGGDAKSKLKFSEKHKLNYPVLNDEDKSVANKYEVVMEKSMFGRKYIGIARITYLINPNGEVAYVWEMVSPAGHAAKVKSKILELIKSK